MTRWVRLLIIANIAVFIWEGQQDRQVVDVFALNSDFFVQRPWTAFTYMFLHSGFSHILFNMLSLYFFGPRVEDRLGGSRFLLLYFMSGLGGVAASLVFTRHVPIVGASAAIFGVLLAFARFWPRAQMLVWGIVPIEARFMVLIMTALSLLGGVGLGQRNVAHFAHLGGFVGGWLVLRAYGVRTWEDKLRPTQTGAAVPRTAPTAAAMDKWKRIPLDQLHPVNREEIERVLAKAATQGPATLTAEERSFLDRFSGL